MKKLFWLVMFMLPVAVLAQTNKIYIYGATGLPVIFPLPESWGTVIATCGGLFAALAACARILMIFLPKGNALIPFLKWVTLIKASDKHAEDPGTTQAATDNGLSTKPAASTNVTS